MKDTIFLDIETYWGFFYLGMKRESDGLRRGVEMSTRHPDAEAARNDVSRWLHQYRTVGYNSLNFDLPLIWLWIEGADADRIKKAADRIIKGRVKWWDVEDVLGIRIPYKVKQNHIDLIEPQPNPFASLKILNGRLHGKQMQDLPFHPDSVPTPDEMDILADYCLQSDLDATHNVWNAMGEAMDLREKVSDELGINVRSKSDTQMGLAIIKNRVEKITGRRVRRGEAKPGVSFRYTPPDYISFETPQLRDILHHIREHDFIVNDKGKVDLPKWLKEAKIRIRSSAYNIGIGGLHSTESNRAIRSSSTHALCDFDVGSYYPAIILNTGLFPKAIGPVFMDVYRGIREDRMKAKKAKDKVTNESLKIALNGTFGSLGSPYSFVYAPHLFISVTLTGQLALLLLIERAEKVGFEVVSGNTDGIVMRIPRDLWAGLDGDRPRPSPLADVVEQWERDTGFVLEGTEYQAIYNQSVNSYYAIKADGGHKRKGPIANPWCEHEADNDLRGQMKKNPQAPICSDAALWKIRHGTPIEDTIRGCRDICQFVTVIAATGGATWRGEYLGKAVRYYWSTDGDPIYKAQPNASGTHPKVPKTEGARECMRLPDEFPDDIDYQRYIAEAESILQSVGFYGDVISTAKPVRLTKANREIVTRKWLVAA